MKRPNQRTPHKERGAALVEMAIILPLLLLMLFGIIESAWAFAQANDVRHGAREGARLAAIDFGDAATIGAEVCSRMDAGNATITVTLTDGSGGVDDGSRGSEGRIVVSLAYTSLTGSLDVFFGPRNLTSDIDFILEQPLTGESQWWNSGSGGTFTCTP
jgi:Flp pilus assembly protein TadG